MHANSSSLSHFFMRGHTLGQIETSKKILCKENTFSWWITNLRVLSLVLSFISSFNYNLRYSFIIHHGSSFSLDKLVYAFLHCWWWWRWPLFAELSESVKWTELNCIVNLWVKCNVYKTNLLSNNALFTFMGYMGIYKRKGDCMHEIDRKDKTGMMKKRVEIERKPVT